MHKDDWSQVTAYVNKTHHNGEPVRSCDDCILAFLRLERCALSSHLICFPSCVIVQAAN